MAWFSGRDPGLGEQSRPGEQVIKIDTAEFDTSLDTESIDTGEVFGEGGQPASPSLLRVDPRPGHSRDGSRSPSDAFSSRNPFRHMSPASPYGDLTSEFNDTSQPLLPLSRQIQIEELEMEELELELQLKKINLRKKRMQLEHQESQRREAERRAEQHRQNLRYSPIAVDLASQEIERQDEARRHFLEVEQQMQRKTDAERIEAEKAELERMEVERVEAERREAERIELERLKAERVEAERVEAERVEAERVEAQRVEAERLEAERVEAERIEAERLEARRAEEKRIETEQREKLRIEMESSLQKQAELLHQADRERKRREAEVIEAQKLHSTQREAVRQREQERSDAETRELEPGKTELQRLLESERLQRQKSARIALSQRQQAERDLLEAEIHKESSSTIPTASPPVQPETVAKPSDEVKPRTISWNFDTSHKFTEQINPPTKPDPVDVSDNATVSKADDLSMVEHQGNAARQRRSFSSNRSDRDEEVGNPETLNSKTGIQSQDEDDSTEKRRMSSMTASDSLEVSTRTSFTSPSGSMLSSHTDEERAWEIAAEGPLSPAKLRELPISVQDELKMAMESHMPQEVVQASVTPARMLSRSDSASKRPPVPPKPTRTPPPTPVQASKSSGLSFIVDPKAPDYRSHAAKVPISASPRSSILDKQSPPSVTSNPFSGFDSDAGAESVDEDWCSCGKVRPSLEECYFCWPCDGTIFCKDCWETCPPHRKNRMRILHNSTGLPHEKTDPALARKIFQTLQSNRDNEEQALLHVQDEDTSWFGAGRDEDDDVVFQDFGRYARLMAEKSVRSRRVRYPSLVSFVGQTGAGKSSLIRLLIELYTTDGTKPQVPVVGSNLHQDVPTSGDVHLYADPKTFKSDNPTLYADCEGLDGGEREPMGARSRHKKDAKDKRTHSFIKHIRKQHHTSERELLWAKTDKTRSREYHVRHLYPRLLYTFSDVIVFVMKNPRVIENAIEQLIRWAEAALETSSNQPVLPHAVIVLNASDNASDPMLWDVNNATVSLMESVRRAVHQNHSMRKFAETWRQRGRSVETVEMLLLSYYSSVRVVRVPERGRPNLINNQLQKLYLEIAEACVRARDSKNDVRMLLNSDELQPYLQYAFDHFSRDLETPFDFVQASFANNPIPANFGGNILKLAINIMEVWKDNLDGPNIFNELSFMVASCIMVDSARHRTLGPADKVFDGYIEFCDSALDEFCNRHWPCEYVHPGTQGRCVNVKAGHQKGHQLVSGKVLTVGSYESTFSTINYKSVFRWKIYLNLQKLLEKLRIATTTAPHLEPQKAADIHREVVLKDFYRHLSGSKAFISHTSCFSCLIAPPEHALPCGHVLCAPCVQAFGKARGRYMIEMRYCPLHSEDSDGQFTPRWPITIKPSCAGVRILSLDGGGVRGIIELMIMQEIEKALGPGLPIQAFFDLIVGTSTGGIIALGLGANGWTVQKCILHFESLCHEAFTRRGLALPGIEWISSNFSRYETKPIEQVLKVVFGEHNLFAGPKIDMDDQRVTQRLTKVAVTATTTAGTAAVLANYNRMDTGDDQQYQFHRSEKPNVEIKTWQAARATSAAPTMFKPFAHEPSGQVYQDGCLWCNCPVEVAMREWRLVWPDVADTHPDIVLSLGTGINPKARKRIAGKISRFGLFSQARALANIAIDKVEASLNSQQTWRTFLERNPLPAHVQGRFIRINLELDKDPPKMDEVRSLEDLKERSTSQFTARKREIKNLADRLIATSFFFVQDEQVAVEGHDDDSVTIAGFIMCRFPPASEEIRSLGETLRSRLESVYGAEYTRHNPYFVIREKGKHHKATQLTLGAEAVDNMRETGIFSLDRIDIHLSDKRVETEILFCLGDQPSHAAFYPISGLPRCLMEDATRGNRPKAPTTPHKKNPSFDPDMAAFEARKAVWRFSPDDVTKGKDPFELYGSPGYKTPGNVSSDTMSKISQRYSTITRTRSGTEVSFSDNNFSLSVPARYLSPFDTYGRGNVVSELSTDPVSQDYDANEPYQTLVDTLLDPGSEAVRRQLIRLLAPMARLSFRHHAIPVGALPLWGSDFVCASDQYRLGFYTRAVARLVTSDVLEMEAKSSSATSKAITSTL